MIEKTMPLQPPRNEKEWDDVFALIDGVLEKTILPSVSVIALDGGNPFKILISTIISLRTRDEVTLTSSKKLFKKAVTPEEMVQLPQKKIEDLIYPAGFYKTKAKNILQICQMLLDKWEGTVPNQKRALMTLPGVGTKTANLTLGLGFGIDAICVDIHVHRIANRLGWIKTPTPEKSEIALEKILPRKMWIPINEMMVHFGQQICKPVSPFCSRCPTVKNCPKIGVDRSR